MTEPGTWLVTKCIERRQPILIPDGAETIASAWRHYADCQRAVVAAFVIMPDHWHAVFSPSRPMKLPQFMRQFNRWVSMSTHGVLDAYDCCWQDGYHEIRIRSSRQLRFCVDYVEQNPCRKGLTATPSEWRWTSAHPAWASICMRPWPWRFERDE